MSVHTDPRFKDEINDKINAGPAEGEDHVLVTVKPGGDGVSLQSAAKSYIKKKGVPYSDIISVEYAGRPEGGFGQVMLVTFKLKETNDGSDGK